MKRKKKIKMPSWWRGLSKNCLAIITPAEDDTPPKKNSFPELKPLPPGARKKCDPPRIRHPAFGAKLRSGKKVTWSSIVNNRSQSAIFF